MKDFRRISCLFLFGILASCSTDEGNIRIIEDDAVKTPEISLSDTELLFVKEYEYVTFNLAPDSYGATVNEKWETDVNLFLQGDISDNYRIEVSNALDEFNNLVKNNIAFNLVNSEEESNIHLIFGEKEAISDVWPDMRQAIGEINFQGYALYDGNGNFNITKGRIWVRSFSIALFRHELGHILGLGHASDDYCDGNFSNNKSFMCSFLKEDFSVFDRAIIQTLYHPDVEVGKTFEQLKPLIEDLLLKDEILVE